MSHINPQALAAELLGSRGNRTQIEQPPSARDPEFSLDDAYATEAEIVRLRLAGGHRVTGRKVGFANKAMWRILKLPTLVWAAMYEDTVIHASGNTAELSASRFYSPRIEPEIVVKLRTGFASEASSSNLDAAGVLNNVDWIAAGFEIIDCPFPGWEFQPVDFVAALGLHAALVIGETLPVEASVVEELAALLPSFKLRLLKNGEQVEEGSGKNSLRSPALCVAELASAALARGNPLQAGELISTGTLTKAQPVAADDLWEAEFEGIGLPKLGLKFT